MCELAERRSAGEHDVLECPSPVARTNCGTLAELLHERARFALRLPRPGAPLIHALALRLHCGGIAGLQLALGAERPDVPAAFEAVVMRTLQPLPADRYADTAALSTGRDHEDFAGASGRA